MKLWGGRFNTGADEAASSFNSSLSFDKRLFMYDIQGTVAHAKMLGKQNIIPTADVEKIIEGLEKILADIQGGTLIIDGNAEDIHSFIETELTHRIGDAGKRVHTARSRNDQVCLDMRMYVRDEIFKIHVALLNLLTVLTDTAKAHVDTIMPGFTHLQKAQPITLAHHCLAYVQMFIRDFERLEDCRKRVNVMPLGSGALAGTVYPIDREFVAKELGFAVITQNSLDAVSDRDFCMEFAFCLSLIMTHLSRFCEEIILWANDAFAFIEIDDKYATGSSIMPQKKNPDMAELIRGKTGRVYGALTTLFTALKGLPLAYNKDMQEDKEAVFDAADTVLACLDIFIKMFATLTFKKDKMYAAAKGGYTNATDAADWLVQKGMPFREAHEIVGRLVLYAIDKKKNIEDLVLADLQAISPVFDNSFYAAVQIETSVNARNITGGPAKAATKKAIQYAQKFINKKNT